MDDIFDFNSSEWGDIVLEESSNNRRLREAPYKQYGMAVLANAVMDLVLVGVFFYIYISPGYFNADVKRLFPFMMIILGFAGLASFIVGYIRLSYKAKPYTLLAKGLTEGTFASFESMPVIELHGPKDKVIVLTRSGTAQPDGSKGKKGYARVLHTPDEYDFGGFAASLRKFGYGGGEETTTTPPPNDAPADDKKEDVKDPKPSDAAGDDKKDEKK